MLTTPPEINQGEREVAILVDAATGVAGKIEPGREVDVIASYAAEAGDPDNKIKPKPARSIVIVPGAKVIAVGQPREKPASTAADAQQDPATVIPVTFALTKRQELKVAHAQVFAADVRLALLRQGDPAERTLGETIFRGRDPPQDRRRGRRRMSARLVIAVADDETARRAAAQAREAELEVVDMVIDSDELHRALRRLDVDVVLLHDALGGTPVLDLARELAAAFPEVGADPARRRGLARPAALGDAGGPARRRRAPARARVLRGQRPRRRRSGRGRCATA